MLLKSFFQHENLYIRKKKGFSNILVNLSIINLAFDLVRNKQGVANKVWASSKFLFIMDNFFPPIWTLCTAIEKWLFADGLNGNFIKEWTLLQIFYQWILRKLWKALVLYNRFGEQLLVIIQSNIDCFLRKLKCNSKKWKQLKTIFLI